MVRDRPRERGWRPGRYRLRVFHRVLTSSDAVETDNVDWDVRPDTTVYVKGNERSVYHTIRDCHQIRYPEIYEETTRESAQKRTWAPCRECVEIVANDCPSSTNSNLADGIRPAAAEADADGDDTAEAALCVAYEHGDDRNFDL